MTLLLRIFLVCALALVAHAQTAQDVARMGLAAMGGEEQLRAISTVHFKAIGHRYEVEQSIRPEGPFVIEYEDIDEFHDSSGRRFRRAVDSRVAMQPPFHDTVALAEGITLRDRGGKIAPGSGDLTREAEAWLELSPERLLLTALAAPNLRREADIAVHLASHHVLSFTWHEAPVRVVLEADSHLLCAMESASPRLSSGFWRFFAGDVTTKVEFSNWWLAKEGVRYPLQWDMTRNSLPDRVLSISDVKLNEPADEKLFPITPELRTQYAARQSADMESIPLQVKQAVEAAPGIVFIAGPWNVTLVRQQDGIVILEAPISSGYSAQVIAEARSRFPGVPIKAVITTSDSWPHLAGIREYVAKEIPVYGLDRNEPILKRWIASKRTFHADSLEQNKHEAKWTFVKGHTSIGKGPNRMEIYPLRTSGGERQMMVYFPEHQLLYGSDLFQKSEAEYYTPETVSELLTAAERERLEVKTYFMMHVAPAPWTELKEMIHSGYSR